jgi:hypothetical protein
MMTRRTHYAGKTGGGVPVAGQTGHKEARHG